MQKAQSATKQRKQEQTDRRVSFSLYHILFVSAMLQMLKLSLSYPFHIKLIMITKLQLLPVVSGL